MLALYEQLAVAGKMGIWQEALEAGEKLLAVAPDLKGVQLWTEHARQTLQIMANRAREDLKDARLVGEKNGPEMVRIPVGKFLYGDNKKKRELPEFWIDKTPVTNAEYARFVAATGRQPPAHWEGKIPPVWRGREKIVDHPVIYVSWHDATAYAKWAGKRLPAEEEWEKAARGVDGRIYPWGDEKPTPALCNFGQNEGGATPVGKYSPQGDSPSGCVDMAGNVWEWTASAYDKSSKVLRGGSWGVNPDHVRSALRLRSDLDDTRGDVGFRCARGSQ
ncbi:MAG: formylglycine-generating enzyme family protein [Anaerolineae bacterium]|nr:formylglycine-generating enzyme family protein [Anaerolineae bacterium]